MSKNVKLAVKTITPVMILTVLLVVTYFTVYEGTHTIHDCTGAACPVCHEIHIAEAFTKQISAAVFWVTDCFILTVSAMYTGTVFSGSVSERNLIADKVRMDN